MRLSMHRTSLKHLVFAVITAIVASSTASAQEVERLTLDQCIDLGMAQQPALRAAQSSLAAAASSEEALSKLRFGALLSPDLPIRKKQACLGVAIQGAQLRQLEWETRYAIIRNYYTVIYADMQLELVRGVVKNLSEARDQAQKLVEKGAGAIKLTRLDVDSLTVNLELVKVKEAEAFVGVLKATAALREAIGIGPEHPLKLHKEELPSAAELDRDALIASALANRGEIAMSALASEVHDLEIQAQRRLLFKVKVNTFAAGSDIHAKPIPTGVANGDYRPGAIGPEMPTLLVGKRNDRADRAAIFYDRSLAVVDKTQVLIALEVEVTYLKWLENNQKIASLAKSEELSKDLADNVRKRFNAGDTTGQEYLQTRGLLDQTRAMLNEARFNVALALAGLERTTGGAYRMPRPTK